MTCRVEQPLQGISLTHYQAQGHSDKPQVLLWLQENFPSIPIGANDLPFVKGVALLVGVSKYAHLPRLDFVENDVDEMLKWLLLEERFDDVYVLRDADATPRSVNNLMFNYFPRMIGPQDRFLFYYSGHGNDVGTNVGYFVFGNATPTFDQDAYLPVDTWRQWSARLPGKEQLFLLDGCSLGLGLTAKSAPRDNDALLRRMAKDPGRLVFSATKGREESYGSAKASYFTQEFLHAVRSEQQDPNSLGFTTIDKVAALMAPNLASLTQLQGVDWFNTTPIPFDRDKYPGTFVFVNPKVSQSSQPAIAGVANAVGKSAVIASSSTAQDSTVLTGAGVPAPNRDSSLRELIIGTWTGTYIPYQGAMLKYTNTYNSDGSFSSLERASDKAIAAGQPRIFSTTGSWNVKDGAFSYEIGTSGAEELLPRGFSETSKIISINDREMTIENAGGRHTLKRIGKVESQH